MPSPSILGNVQCSMINVQCSMALVVVVEVFFYFLHCQVVGGFECSDAGAEDLRHVLIFHFLEIFEGEHCFLFLWQLVNRLLQHGSSLVAIEVVVALQTLGKVDVLIVYRDIRFLFRHIREAFVDGDAAEPSIEFGVVAEGVDIGPGLEEGVLKHVVGIVVEIDDTADLPVQLLAVLAHHTLKGLASGLGVFQLIDDDLFVEGAHGLSLLCTLQPWLLYLLLDSFGVKRFKLKEVQVFSFSDLDFLSLKKVHHVVSF